MLGFLFFYYVHPARYWETTFPTNNRLLSVHISQPQQHPTQTPSSPKSPCCHWHHHAWQSPFQPQPQWGQPQGKHLTQVWGDCLGHKEVGVLPHQNGNYGGAVLLEIFQSGWCVRTTTTMTTMAMVASTVMAGQRGWVGRGQGVDEVDSLMKATTTTTMASTLPRWTLIMWNTTMPGWGMESWHQWLTMRTTEQEDQQGANNNMIGCATPPSSAMTASEWAGGTSGSIRS